MHRRVVLWDWELMHLQVYVYINFVYRVVYVDMSTRSSQLNHLNLEKNLESTSTPPPPPPRPLSLFLM